MQHDWKTFESALRKDLQRLRSGEKESLRFLVAVHPVIWYWLIAAEQHLLGLPCLNLEDCHHSEMHFLLERLAQCDQTMSETALLDFVDNAIRCSFQRLSVHQVSCKPETGEEVWPWAEMPYSQWRYRRCVELPSIRPVSARRDDDQRIDALLNHLKTWYQ